MTDRNFFQITLPDDPTHLGRQKFALRTEPGQGNQMMMVEDKHGNQLGISFNEDGTITVGGWNADGEWTELVLMADVGCMGGHLHPFPLDQYTQSLAEQESDLPLSMQAGYDPESPTKEAYQRYLSACESAGEQPQTYEEFAYGDGPK